MLLRSVLHEFDVQLFENTKNIHASLLLHGQLELCLSEVGGMRASLEPPPDREVVFRVPCSCRACVRAKLCASYPGG